MNKNKYFVFLEVIDCGNLTKAAENLNYSQPAISNMIRSMEQEYGFPLLIRTSTRVIPTKEALKIIPRIREIVYNENAIREEVNRINNIETGKISIATYSSAISSFLPDVIHTFTERHPSIEISLIEGNMKELDLALKNRIADFAIVSRFDFPDYDFIPLVQDRLMAVLPSGHPLTKKDIVTPEELFKYPIIAPDEDSDTDLRELSRLHNIEPDIKIRSNQDSSLLNLVASNIGVTVLSSLAVSQHDEAIETRPLEAYYNSRTVGVSAISTESLSPACRDFIAILKNSVEL